MMKRKEEKAKGKGQRAKSQGQRPKNAKMQECENTGMPVRQEGGPECGTSDNNLPVLQFHNLPVSQFHNLPVSQFDNLTNEISTVFHIKKPSANGILFPAEGCISGSRADRACLMIRFFNN